MFLTSTLDIVSGLGQAAVALHATEEVQRTFQLQTRWLSEPVSALQCRERCCPWRNSKTVYRCFNSNLVVIPSVMFQALFGAATPKNWQSHEHLYSHPTFETNAFGCESFQIGEGLLCYFDMIFNRSPCVQRARHTLMKNSRITWHISLFCMNDGNLQRSKLLCSTTVLELIKRAFIPAIGVFTPRSARIFQHVAN